MSTSAGVPEVTAQRMLAAFNAVKDIVEAIEEREAALLMTPIGRELIDAAQAVRQRLPDDG